MAMVTAYAQALERLVSEQGMSEKDAFEKLRAHLAATGRLKLLPQLARELRTIEARRATAAPVLEAATAADAKAAEAAAHKLGVTAKAQINPDLIRGWRLRANGAITDHSAKRSLVELYRKITA